VIGLGNPILGDDAVGWHVLDAVEARLRAPGGDVPSGVALERLTLGGLGLMERLMGFDRAIVVDALLGGGQPPGTVSVGPLARFTHHRASHIDGVHDATLPAALEAGRALGAMLPDEVTVVAIDIERGDEFGERLTPAVAAAVPAAVDAVLASIRDA
jgi:hydrogenase maturation protease